MCVPCGHHDNCRHWVYNDDWRLGAAGAKRTLTGKRSTASVTVDPDAKFARDKGNFGSTSREQELRRRRRREMPQGSVKLYCQIKPRRQQKI